MTRPKVPDDKRIRTAQACESCKRRKQKVSILSSLSHIGILKRQNLTPIMSSFVPHADALSFPMARGCCPIASRTAGFGLARGQPLMCPGCEWPIVAGLEALPLTYQSYLSYRHSLAFSSSLLNLCYERSCSGRNFSFVSHYAYHKTNPETRCSVMACNLAILVPREILCVNMWLKTVTHMFRLGMDQKMEPLQLRLLRIVGSRRIR